MDASAAAPPRRGAGRPSAAAMADESFLRVRDDCGRRIAVDIIGPRSVRGKSTAVDMEWPEESAPNGRANR